MTDVNNTAVEATTVETPEVNPVVAETTIPEKYVGKTIEDVIKMHQEAEKFIGKKVDESPEEIVNKFLKVPEAPEEYLINEELDQNLAKQLAELGLKTKVTQEQMKSISDKLIEVQRTQKEAEKAKADEYVSKNEKALKEEFGIAYDERIKDVRDLITKYGQEGAEEELKASGLLHNAKFVSLLAKVSSDVLQHTLVGSDFTKRTLTPSEAKAEIANKRADKEFMEQYLKRGIGHEQAVQKMEELYRIAFQS